MTEDQMIELEIAEIAEFALNHPTDCIHPKHGPLTTSIIAQVLDLSDERLTEIRERIDAIKLESQRIETNTEVSIYKKLFPNVSFNDKVLIHFNDGSKVFLKHLYSDDSALHDIRWEDVLDCHEV
tara:strand:+ start:2108 stop:2482 length:375 start_codon:yes stop_codon:yes gene_type:complete